MSSQIEGSPALEALQAALVEIERHVAASGWDQPARLFALVRTQALVDSEPSLADQLIVTAPDALSSVEQDDFHAGQDLMETLARIVWPATVDGCALSCERTFLPAAFEADVPADTDQAAQFVSEHPLRQDIRLVSGVLRTGERFSIARLVSDPAELLGGQDLVPQLSDALVTTFEPDMEVLDD